MSSYVKVLKLDEPIQIEGVDCVYLYKEREFVLPLQNSQMLISYMTNTGFRAKDPIDVEVDISGIESSDEAFWASVATQLSLPSHTLISQTDFQSEITPTETSEEKLAKLREVRNGKLAETDWWASSDLTMTTEQTTYRQALRNITDNYSSLDTVVWPTKP